MTKFSSQDKKEVNTALAIALACQRTYGKQGQDLELLCGIFLEVLKAYKADQITRAFDKWLRTSPEFPTPADIISILEAKPKMSDAVYRQMLKKYKDSGYNEYTEAGRYVLAYEAEFGSNR